MEENKWSDVLSNCIRNAHHLLWKNPNTDSLVSCTERQIQQFTCSLQHIPKNGVVIKNDQCISTLTHITHDIEPIINLMLKCSEHKKVLLIFFNVVLLLVVNECWTEQEDVNELSPEGGAWETDQVSCLSWVKQSNNQQVEWNFIRIQIPFILFICGFPVRRHLLKYLLHSSSLLCTSSLPFPHASCSCKVLASIQWTLWWSFHQLHISSFRPLSYCSNLECQNSDLSGSYLHQTFKITFYILEEVFSFDLIAETVNFCEEKLCTISLFQFDVIVLEITHQTLADIRILILKYTAFLNTSFVFFLWTVIRFKSNIVQCLKFGFAVSVMANLWLLTNLTSTQFLMFSKVFSDDRIIPRIFMLSPICFFNQGFLWNFFPWIFKPRTRYCSRSFCNELCISPYHTGLAQAFQPHSSSTSEGQVGTYNDHHEALFNIQDPPWGCKVLISSCQNKYSTQNLQQEEV